MSPVPRSLVRAVLFPLAEAVRGRSTPRRLRHKRRHDRLSPGELQALHDRLLVRHLRWAAATVPWYRGRVDADRIRGPADLARFPILDKAAVREAGPRLRSEAFRGRLIPLETGGSSGEPLRFLSDPVRESDQLACKWRARAWFGLHPGHREAQLWGSPIETARHDAVRRLAARALGVQLISAFRLDDQAMEGFASRLSGGRADFLYGYATALARYARFLEVRERELRHLGLRVAICTAETLLPQDRAVIERRIAPVANEYGCRDGGLIAHEDPGGRLRLMHDAVHVEVVSEALEPLPAGEEGEAVVTNLAARGCPLVRYRLGDRLALEPGAPPAGLPHPALASLSGRATDLLVATDGARVHALAIIYVLREIEGVTKFRVVQESRTHLRILVVPDPGLDVRTLAPEITRKARRVLGEDLRVDVAAVDDLEPLPSGKHCYVICRVADG